MLRTKVRYTYTSDKTVYLGPYICLVYKGSVYIEDILYCIKIQAFSYKKMHYG